MEFLFIFLYYLLFLAWLFLAYHLFLLLKNFFWWRLFYVLGAGLLIWAAFFEPYLIKTNSYKLELSKEEKLAQPLKVVFITDIHFSVLNRLWFAERVVEKINKLQPDIVLLGGDYVYYPPKKDLENNFSFIQKIEAPVLAVLGNHDRGMPGKDLGYKIEELLVENGAFLLEKEAYLLEKEEKKIFFWGIGDLWTAPVFRQPDKAMEEAELVIALSHNPDISHYLPFKPDILISGHTHGGQIRLPWLYKLVIPSNFGYDQGLYSDSDFPVFVSSGLGTIGLPFRLFNFPAIEYLEIY